MPVFLNSDLILVLLKEVYHKLHFIVFKILQRNCLSDGDFNSIVAIAIIEYKKYRFIFGTTWILIMWPKEKTKYVWVIQQVLWLKHRLPLRACFLKVSFVLTLGNRNNGGTLSPAAFTVNKSSYVVHVLSMPHDQHGDVQVQQLFYIFHYCGQNSFVTIR